MLLVDYPVQPRRAPLLYRVAVFVPIISRVVLLTFSVPSDIPPGQDVVLALVLLESRLGSPVALNYNSAKNGTLVTIPLVDIPPNAPLTLLRKQSTDVIDFVLQDFLARLLQVTTIMQLVITFRLPRLQREPHDRGIQPLIENIRPPRRYPIDSLSISRMQRILYPEETNLKLKPTLLIFVVIVVVIIRLLSPVSPDAQCNALQALLQEPALLRKLWNIVYILSFVARVQPIQLVLVTESTPFLALVRSN